MLMNGCGLERCCQNYDEISTKEMYPQSSVGCDLLKRKEWFPNGNGNKAKFRRFEVGEISTANRSKQQDQEIEETISEQDGNAEGDEKGNMLRGAVGPKPPLPP